MRNQNRIKPLLKKLEQAWNPSIEDGTKTAQLRLGQLLINILHNAGINSDAMWNLEDDQWLAAIEKWTKDSDEKRAK